MPIVDVELVCASEAEFRAVSANAMANAVGAALGCDPGHAWVRLRYLGSECYSENRASLSPAELPVFVTVLLARIPSGPQLDAQVGELTKAIADVAARPADRVHIEYAPAAAGRQSFGGQLVPLER